MEEGIATNYYEYLKPYLCDVLIKKHYGKIENLTVARCEAIFKDIETLKLIIGEDKIDAINHFRSGIRHFEKYILAHPEFFTRQAR